MDSPIIEHLAACLAQLNGCTGEGCWQAENAPLLLQSPVTPELIMLSPSALLWINSANARSDKKILRACAPQNDGLPRINFNIP